MKPRMDNVTCTINQNNNVNINNVNANNIDTTNVYSTGDSSQQKRKQPSWTPFWAYLIISIISIQAIKYTFIPTINDVISYILNNGSESDEKDSKVNNEVSEAEDDETQSYPLPVKYYTTLSTTIQDTVKLDIFAKYGIVCYGEEEEKSVFAGTEIPVKYVYMYNDNADIKVVIQGVKETDDLMHILVYSENLDYVRDILDGLLAELDLKYDYMTADEVKARLFEKDMDYLDVDVENGVEYKKIGEYYAIVIY